MSDEKKGKGAGHAAGRHGEGRLFQRGRRWWVQYYAGGRQVRESSRSTKKEVARRLLRRRLVQAEDGTAPPGAKPPSYEEMRARLVTAWLLRQPRLTAREADQRLARLDESFKGLSTSVISEERIEEFKLARKAAGASNATVNRALAALRQMFKLSARHLKSPPEIRLLPEPPARRGFLDREGYLRLCAALPADLRPLTAFAYHLGMRLGELRRLRWKNVNAAEAVIRLEADQTKNRRPREIPFGRIPELTAALEQLRWGAPDGFVFTRSSGAPLVAIRKAWNRACLRAGLARMGWACPVCHQKIGVARQPWPPEHPAKGAEAPRCECGAVCGWHYDGLIFHDLRRTALRNLRRAGVAESVAMAISGHRTRHVFERYNIVDAADVAQAIERLDHFQRAEDERLASAARPN